MNISGRASMSAPASFAVAHASRALAALPGRSPTVAFNWPMVRRKRSVMVMPLLSRFRDRGRRRKGKVGLCARRALAVDHGAKDKGKGDDGGKESGRVRAD